MPADSTKRLRLSIFQLMKLVVFFAVAFASVAPMVHLWQAGVVQGGSLSGLAVVAIFEGVLVPLIMGGAVPYTHPSRRHGETRSSSPCYSAPSWSRWRQPAGCSSFTFFQRLNLRPPVGTWLSRC